MQMRNSVGGFVIRDVQTQREDWRKYEEIKSVASPIQEPFYSSVRSAFL